MRIGPLAVRSVFVLFVFASLLFSVAAHAAAAPTRIDQRISAIPAPLLLQKTGMELVDPRRQQAANELATINRPLFFAWALFQIFAFLYLWRSGTAARWRDALRRRIRSEHVLRFVFGALLAVVAQVCALPVSFTRFRLAYAAGLTTQTVASWMQDWVTAVAIDALIAGMFIVIVLWLVDLTRLWYMLAIVLVFAGTLMLVFIEPVVLAPLFNVYTPLANPRLTANIHALTERAAVGDPPIYTTNLSKQTEVGNAWVSGFGATRRIVLGDTLVAVDTPDEAAFIVAHELGHYVNRDVIKLSLVATTLFIASMAIAVLIGDRIGFRRDDDPVSRLPLIGCILACVALVVFPIYNAYSRGVEARADRFALALTHDPAAGVRAFVRFADDGLSPVCPPAIVRLYFYDHPPLGSRIAAMQGRPDPCP
jgi:Zn-dependent protease with chaperone function